MSLERREQSSNTPVQLGPSSLAPPLYPRLGILHHFRHSASISRVPRTTSSERTLLIFLLILVLLLLILILLLLLFVLLVSTMHNTNTCRSLRPQSQTPRTLEPQSPETPQPQSPATLNGRFTESPRNRIQNGWITTSLDLCAEKRVKDP